MTAKMVTENYKKIYYLFLLNSFKKYRSTLYTIVQKRKVKYYFFYVYVRTLFILVY